jgi:DNA polymerase-3 subunit delta'
MPFPAAWIESKIAEAAQRGRLGHAFLVVSPRMEDARHLFHNLAARLLDNPDPGHPDLHLVEPESKSRRITIQQIRELEHALRLKSYAGGRKVACIMAADRMCVGTAEPANAFLKTLEEPPENTIIFLVTDRPEALLPTIRSRCLLLPLSPTEEDTPDPDLSRLLNDWSRTEGPPIDIAYRRASLLTSYWQDLRANLEDEFKTLLKEADDNAEKALQALLESRFIVQRDRSIAHLIRLEWGRTDLSAARSCHALEELRQALNRNMDQSLAVERCCLKISGLI